MSRLHGEIESPRPLHARDGLVSVTGWCLLAGHAEPPAVRLATSAGALPLTARHPRRDVAAQRPREPAAAHCGFTITGRLPAGVYEARLEACLPDGSWRCFRALSLAVEPPHFRAGIELPAATGTITRRLHVEGWALRHDQPVQALSVRYGHQEISCVVGRRRPDLPAAHPGVAHAARAGFKSRTILSAGRGPVRLKARFADGSVEIARSLLQVDVATDENHAASLELAAPRIPLPVAPLQPVFAQPIQTRPLNLLFILPGSFAANSALHVAGLANELAAAGHRCAVAVAHDPSTLAHHLRPSFTALTHAQAAAGVTFPDGRGPDVIHAWTTRENVRRLALPLAARHQARLVVHLEDNEQEILALTLRRSFAELDALDDATLDALVPPDLSHPHHSRAFLAAATGVTHITERLAEFVPAAKSRLTLTPAADARCFFPRPVPRAFRRQLGLPPRTTVLFYHGNVHAANAAEVRELYAAVLQLNRAGSSTLLLRTGLDAVDFLGPLAGEVAPHVLSLGQILHHHHLPPLMALADFFVQPGRADAFNDYRFPSKLPEFFALGRPVILPRTNLGLQLRHGVDAYVLDQAGAAGIAAAITELWRDPALRKRLGTGATAFAAQHFSWRRSAEALASFYAGLTA
ncbi:putative glycosyl transferase [Lacunisphaera limnophila]|uniref:Putative glycosyl transferase n=1 Tax=Lacunisphaera limnophila TaxID=1838286 RepID=A0A1D8AVR1_9BACT|nr:glycosyltransferase [Lacunisphaera limnophila]AOS44972.1 putative glycosyl transferase [Lacunisphaera limnophila]